MKVQTSPRVTASPQREQAHRAYVQAQAELEEVSVPHLDKVERFEKYADVAGVASGVVSGAALAYYVISSGTDPQALMGLGAVVIPVGMAAHYLVGKVTEANIEKTTMPAFRSAREELIAKREAYRDTLLDEINDPKVRQRADVFWGELRDWENNIAPYGGTPAKKLARRIENLESMANHRLESGWESRLANRLVDPGEFVDRLTWIEAHPEVEGVLESYEQDQGGAA